MRTNTGCTVSLPTKHVIAAAAYLSGCLCPFDMIYLTYLVSRSEVGFCLKIHKFISGGKVNEQTDKNSLCILAARHHTFARICYLKRNVEAEVSLYIPDLFYI